MDRDYARHGTPMVQWKWRYNPNDEAASLPWIEPAYDDQDWPVTHVIRGLRT